MPTATQTAMRDALTAMEQALVDLARAYHQYEAGYQAAAREVYLRTPPPAHVDQRVYELDHAIGLTRVDTALASRLRTVGLQEVLNHPGTAGLGAEWVATLSAEVDKAVVI